MKFTLGLTRIQMACPDRKKAVRPIRTAPYPGFPTDAQPPVLAALCTAEGTSVFVETIFENRFRHCGELLRMGADIRVEGRVAVICGVKRLQGTLVHAPDLRGGSGFSSSGVGSGGRQQNNRSEPHRPGVQQIAPGSQAVGCKHLPER